MSSKWKFNPHGLAILKLPHKIELDTDPHLTSVGILPCEVHLMPNLPKKLRIIPEFGKDVGFINKEDNSFVFYHRVSEGIGVIRKHRKRFYLHIPIPGYLPEGGCDLSHIQAFASGKVGKNNHMKVTHMYIDPNRIPDSAKTSRLNYIFNWIAVFSLSILGILSLVGGFLGFKHQFILTALCVLLLLPLIIEIRRIVWTYK